MDRLVGEPKRESFTSKTLRAVFQTGSSEIHERKEVHRFSAEIMKLICGENKGCDFFVNFTLLRVLSTSRL